MTNLLSTIRRSARDITNIDEYALALNELDWDSLYGVYSGYPNVQQTLTGNTVEEISANFVGLASRAYKANGVVFACMLVRASVFSTARLRFQTLSGGRPSGMFGTDALTMFERPWTGGTTQDMLNRMIQDADLAGNSFQTYIDGEIVRLRPDWIDIVVEKRMFRGGQLGWKKLGYLYWEGGRRATDDPVPLMLDEVCHWMPNPDPEASFKGMSWLTPIIKEIQADHQMTAHKSKFFENGATPNMVIKHNTTADPAKVERFDEMMRERSGGIRNAYKTLNLYPGADVTVVGADLRQIDFKQVQGGGETRIAAAAGVPPVIVGLSEGLAAATYSNYGQARRRLADGTAHPLWQNMAGSMEPLIPQASRPPGTGWRLWYDVADVPFLREDAKDAAEIAEVKARTIRVYCDAGFTPESALAAVDADDIRLLKHTGLFSVQLQPPGSIILPPGGAPPPTPPATPNGKAVPNGQKVGA